MDAKRHQAEILDQFTRQAEPFLQRHARGHDDLLVLMAECARVRREDALLDIACGPGIVSCFFAGCVRHVTGLDMVPAMLERAERLRAERDLDNVAWKLGDSASLPFADSSFDSVVTRFSFHHFLEPLVVLHEMRRVCKPEGTVLVADVTPDAVAQAKFNEWETLRDPSHTRALTVEGLRSLGESAGLNLLRLEPFGLGMELDDLLKGSFPRPGNEGRIRAMFEEEIRNGTNALGVAAHREEGVVRITYPVSVMAWVKR